MDNAKAAAVIAALFLAFGIVGTLDMDAEIMAELERENEALRTYAQTQMRDCAAPQPAHLTTAALK
jgi:hypothetical protein